MTKPTEFERSLGRFVRSKLGSDTHVVRFGDDDGIQDVFVVDGPDCPCEGVTSYGSVGLSRRKQRSGEMPVTVEILGACASQVRAFPNLIASCVFDSAKNNANIAYGAYIENLVGQYDLSQTLRHVTFVAPFLWDGFHKAEIDGLVIHWLLMLPISDKELEHLGENGITSLEAAFERARIDVFDIHRPSVF